MLDEKFIIEIEYKGKPEDKETTIEKLKQKIYDDFGCIVVDYKPKTEEDPDIKPPLISIFTPPAFGCDCDIEEYINEYGK